MLDLALFPVPAAERVADFMTALERTRGLLQPDAWKALVKTSAVIKAWRYFLCLDPYTRWGLIKPRGYPGDATLMDFAYGHDSIREHMAHAGAVGQQIYAQTSGARQSQSARERIGLLRQQIAARAALDPFGVVSVAAGHARELEDLDPAARARIRSFTAIDIDPIALGVAQGSAAGLPFTAVRRNVIKDELADVAHAELVYSLGLFDYLLDEHADSVLAKMLSVTAAGGTCVVANLAPDAANLGYCEAIMDWWMVTRDEVAMRALGERAAAARGGDLVVRVQRHGCFNYLSLGRRVVA